MITGLKPMPKAPQRPPVPDGAFCCVPFGRHGLFLPWLNKISAAAYYINNFISGGNNERLYNNLYQKAH